MGHPLMSASGPRVVVERTHAPGLGNGNYAQGISNLRASQIGSRLVRLGAQKLAGSSVLKIVREEQFC